MVKDVGQFLQEVRLELGRVVWPKFQEWTGATIVVLFLVFVFALYLGFVDFCFARLAQFLLKRYGG
jgi:preprotein translocase subunit SecE